VSFFTGSSKLATVRRRTPNTLKNSFQKVWDSARSRPTPPQSRAKSMAFWRISFQLSGGMAGFRDVMRGCRSDAMGC